jgi:CubicO group peptidase (beta-lactamase class C family)
VRLTYLSAKALRLYHEAGILEPAEVDPAPGYRYYNASQARVAQVIRRLRDLDSRSTRSGPWSPPPACASATPPSSATWRGCGSSSLLLCHDRGGYLEAVMSGLVSAGASELEAKLNGFVTENRLPGATAAVVHGDELAWIAGTGFTDQDAGRPGQPAALYRIASITKTFTGTAVLQLRDAGRLDLDDPAVAYLPELRGAVSPFAAIETVTIRRMLSHESGLATEPPGTDWSVPLYQGAPEVTLAQASDIILTLPPNRQHKYSDIAYQLLGEIVTRVSGTPYPRYVQESILDPLGMSATAFEPLKEPLLGRRATGYDWRPASDQLEPAPTMSPVWAEGGLWSCAEDMARWLSFQLRAYQQLSADSPVLPAASLREMHKPRYLADDDWTSAWGISWCANRRDHVTWIQHSGGLPGFTSTVCFDPREQVGAIVLINGTSRNVELAPELASVARRLARSAPPVTQTPTPMPEQYRPLLGIYAGSGLAGGVLRLEWCDGRLAFVNQEPAPFRLALEPTSNPDTFAAEQGSYFSGENVTFHRRADGRVISVLLVASTFMRLDQVPPY